jgi:cold shock protein
MEQGKVVRITDRGFGFISREGEEKDLFFHANEVKNVQFNDLHEGDAVTFELSEGPKGPNAVNVNKVEA